MVEPDDVSKLWLVPVGLSQLYIGNYCGQSAVSFKGHTFSTESGLRRICNQMFKLGTSGHHMLLLKQLIGQFITCIIFK